MVVEAMEHAEEVVMLQVELVQLAEMVEQTTAASAAEAEEEWAVQARIELVETLVVRVRPTLLEELAILYLEEVVVLEQIATQQVV